MHDSDKEKYLGDIVCDDGKIDENVSARCAKGYGIAGDILAILDELPLGTFRVAAGLQMRNGMLIGGMLTSSECWIGIKERHYTQLERVDEFLIRGIVRAHPKTVKEMLHAETGTRPLRFEIQNRRINYLHHILTRNKEELISRVFFAQVRRPVKNDWAVTVRKDLTDTGINLSLIHI